MTDKLLRLGTMPMLPGAGGRSQSSRTGIRRGVEKTLEKVLPEVEMQYRAFLQNDFSGRLRGDDLWLTPHNELAHNMVKRDAAVLELIKKKAGIVAGKPVRVRMGEERAGALGADDKLAQLIGDMAGYDNMKVQQ